MPEGYEIVTQFQAATVYSSYGQMREGKREKGGEDMKNSVLENVITS